MYFRNAWRHEKEGDEEQLMSQQTPYMKPPTYKQRGTATEEPLCNGQQKKKKKNWGELKPVLLRGNFTLSSDAVQITNRRMFCPHRGVLYIIEVKQIESQAPFFYPSLGRSLVKKCLYSVDKRWRITFRLSIIYKEWYVSVGSSGKVVLKFFKCLQSYW